MRPSKSHPKQGAPRGPLYQALGIGLLLSACASGETGPTSGKYNPGVSIAEDDETPGGSGEDSSATGGASLGGSGDSTGTPGGTQPSPSDGSTPTGAGQMPTTGGQPTGGGAPTPSGGGGTSTASTTCSAPDWSNVKPLRVQDDAGESLRELRAVVQGKCLFVAVGFDDKSSKYSLFLDTDGNGATGFRADGTFSVRSGADYLVQGGLLHSYTGSAGGWGWSAQGSAIQETPAARSHELHIPLSAIGASASAKIWLGFIQEEGTHATSRIPNTGSFASLSMESTGTDSSFPAANCPAPIAWTPSPPARTRGMIVPAEGKFDNMSRSSWARLKSAGFPGVSSSLEVSSGSDTWSIDWSEFDWLQLRRVSVLMQAYAQDLWIVARGSNEGPFTSSGEWGVARDVWSDIQASEAKIFGYVKTARNQGASAELIPVDEVLAQIKVWVDNYPQLDGIMLDGFNPSFELFGSGSDAGSAPTGCRAASPTYPNGVCAAPQELRSFGSTCFDPANAIKPAGGHYHTLIGKIRAKYGRLLLIGNAGRQLESNQRAYADLVDALITYDASYAKAGAPSAQLGGSRNEAARLYGVAYDSMQRALDAAIRGGYSHVYATNLELGETQWLASYLEEAITYLVQRPR